MMTVSIFVLIIKYFIYLLKLKEKIYFSFIVSEKVNKICFYFAKQND